MMGRQRGGQKPLFYSFNLDDHVPPDHLLRMRRAVVVLRPKGVKCNPRDKLMARSGDASQFLTWRELADLIETTCA